MLGHAGTGVAVIAAVDSAHGAVVGDFRVQVMQLANE